MEECCDICGSVGVPDALVTCSQCKTGLQHMYCMRARFLEYPDDWCCEECEPSSKPTFSQLANCSEVLANCSEVCKGAAQPSKIRKLRNESKLGPFNCEKKVATRKTAFISINDVIKLPSGAIDSSSRSKVTCQSSTSRPPTREEKSCFSLKNSAFDVRWTSSPVHSRSTPCVSPTQGDKMSKAEMVRMRKIKKTEVGISGMTSVDLGLIEQRKKSASRGPFLQRKKGTSSNAHPTSEEGETSLLRSEATGKGSVVELGDSLPIFPSSIRSQKAPFSFGDSLMQSGSGQAAWYFLQNLLLEVDLPLVQQATDQEVNEKMALGLLQGSFWAARTRDAFVSSRNDMDDVWARHAALTKQFQNFADRAVAEKDSLMAESKVAVERAELAEQRALERAKLAEQEKDRLIIENLSLKQEAEAVWKGKKEEFLKSREFDFLCSEKALAFFKQGFKCCLDQFRAHGYSETEHPASFLDVDKALEALPEEGEILGTEEAVREGTDPKST